MPSPPASSPAIYPRLGRHPFQLALWLGGAIGVVVAFGLYITKPTLLLLVPVGLLGMLSAIFFKNIRLYWFAVLLLSLQFQITKNLNDGLAVMQALNINYTIWNFTFDITVSDLVILVLLVIWANDCLFHGKSLRFPRVTWLAVGYLGFCLVSLIGATSPYLGAVELFRQTKFFIVYLYAVNCLDTKPAMRVLAACSVVILLTQGAMTMVRFETGYLAPITLGQTYEDQSEMKQYLAVDRSVEGSAVRGFGTLESPGSTVRLCMMAIPFALLLCAPNAMFRMRWMFVGLTAVGLAGLILTFTRVFYITTAFQCALCFLIMLRDRMLSKREATLIVVLVAAALAAASPKIYYQFTVREDSVSVRFLQYEATFKMILANPLLGVGLNNSTGEKQKYSNLTYDPTDPDTQFDMEPTHNGYLSLTSEIGVIGAALFFAFFARATFVAWRQSRLATDPEVRLVANALVVAFCSVAVNSLMDPLEDYPLLMMLWLFAGISHNLATLRPGAQRIAARPARPRARLPAAPRPIGPAGASPAE